MLRYSIAAVIGLAALSAPASADFTYEDFSDTTGLQLNGNATTAGTGAGTVLRVTPSAPSQSGSVFSSSPVSLTDGYSFSTSFTFNFNQQGGIEGADGLVFVVQTNSSTVGGGGGGIGYAGIPNSLGVEFDSYNNGSIDDNSANHVGVNLNGEIDSVLLAESPFVLDSANDLTAWIDYNSSTQLLEVFLNDSDTRPSDPFLSYMVDLQSILGGGSEAFVGFTSGTGGGWANHDVLNWAFVDSYNPIGGAVPEPGTWAMMLVGFGATGFAFRRSRERRLANLPA